MAICLLLIPQTIESALSTWPEVSSQHTVRRRHACALVMNDSLEHTSLMSEYPTTAGTGIAGYRDAEVPSQAHIYGPVGVAYRAQTGELFVSDSNSRIRVIRGNGAVETISNGAGLAGYSDSVGLSVSIEKIGPAANS